MNYEYGIMNYEYISFGNIYIIKNMLNDPVFGAAQFSPLWNSLGLPYNSIPNSSLNNSFNFNAVTNSTNSNMGSIPATGQHQSFNPHSQANSTLHNHQATVQNHQASVHHQQNAQSQQSVPNQQSFDPNAQMFDPNSWANQMQSNMLQSMMHQNMTQMQQQQSMYQRQMLDQQNQLQSHYDEQIRKMQQLQIQQVEQQKKDFEQQLKDQQDQYQQQLNQQNQQIQQLQTQKQQPSVKQKPKQNVKQKKKNQDSDSSSDSGSSDDDSNDVDDEFRKLSQFPRDGIVCDQGFTEEEFRHVFPYLSAGDSEGNLLDDYSISTIAEVAKDNMDAKKRLNARSVALDKQLLNNLNLVTKGKKWSKHWDDRKTRLHPVRFDRFPLTNSQELFVMAAHHFADKKINLLSVKHYDLASLNLPNTICDKGFDEAHKPGSQGITMKFFLKENFEKQKGATKWALVNNDDGDQVPQSTIAFIEVDSMEKFHHAFFCLKIVKFRATPWDRSLEVVELYLIDVQWFAKNPLNNGFHRYISQGQFCAMFVDFCLHDNAQRFEAKKEHIGSREMDTTLSAFCRDLGSSKGKFNPSTSSSSNASSNKKPQGQSSAPAASSSTTVSKSSRTPYQGTKKFDVNTFKIGPQHSQYIEIFSICKDFNLSTCNNTAENNRCVDENGVKRLHVCSKRNLAAFKFPCGQLHSLKDHK